MSHLGRRLSALIDGELNGAERDRVHAHLARCVTCRAEAKEMRELKRRMSALRDVASDDELTRRLVAIAEPGEPVPSRRRPRQARRARIGGPARPAAPPAHPAFRGFGPAARPVGARYGPRRGRYVAFGVASCVVVGLGVTAFTVGGGQGAPGPRITPPVQMYSIEHAITTGQVPFGGSSAAPDPDVSGPAQQP
ncbi:MAG TPA: zf-HC2 domain-containing protein [Streptosporangiaceae bacterium]